MPSVWVGLEIPVTKNSLLAVLFNPYKDDLIQSVTPGGHDASIDWRGISNHIKTARITHVITQGEIDQAWAVISVTWPTAFSDANYTATWSVRDVQTDNTDADYVPGDMHNTTAAGFDAVLLVGIYAIPVAGETVIINAMAIHD